MSAAQVMLDCRPSQVADILAALIPTGGPVLIEGPPGVGKSALMAQAAAATSRRLYAPRVGQYQPEDVAGLPWPDAEAGTVRFLASGTEFPWCPCPGACNCPPSVLFLDELGQAPTSVQNVVLQLIHHSERRLRCFRLPPPDRCFVAAATNRTSDRAGSGALTTAVRSRFLTALQLVPHLDDLMHHAAAAGWHPTVRSWLRLAPQYLMDFDPARPGPFACPRSLESLSRLAALDLATTHRMIAYAGAVGVPAAASYLAHAELAGKVPSAAEILAQPATMHVPTEAPLLWAVATILSHAMRDVTDAPTIEAMLTYAGRMPGEYAALTVLDSMAAGAAVLRTRAGMDWAKTNRHLITAAREAA